MKWQIKKRIKRSTISVKYAVEPPPPKKKTCNPIGDD